MKNPSDDFGNVLDAEIEIDDDSSVERQTQPYAYISTRDGYYCRVEIIDILKSVRSNAASVGHPAIVLAIRHWQQIIETEGVFRNADYFNDMQTVKIAQRNFKAIGEALIEAPRLLPKELSFLLDVQRLQLDTSLLRDAFDDLEPKGFNLKTKDGKGAEYIQILEDCLKNRPARNGLVSVDDVIGFLTDKAGKRFMMDDEGNSHRKGWKIFSNAFLAWHRKLKQGTVQKYLKTGKKASVPADKIVLPTFRLPPEDSIRNIINSVLSIPLEYAQEPVILHESEIAMKGIAAALVDLVAAPTQAKANQA